MKSIRKLFVIAWMPLMILSILGIIGGIDTCGSESVFLGVLVNIFVFICLFWLVGVEDIKNKGESEYEKRNSG